MPLLKGKENIGHNIKVEEEHGKPKAQATAIALRTAGVPKKGEDGLMNQREEEQLNKEMKRAGKTGVEAYGVKGFKNTAWRKAFKSREEMEKWVEKNDAEVYGTRDTSSAYDVLTPIPTEDDIALARHNAGITKSQDRGARDISILSDVWMLQANGKTQLGGLYSSEVVAKRAAKQLNAVTTDVVYTPVKVPAKKAEAMVNRYTGGKDARQIGLPKGGGSYVGNQIKRWQEEVLPTASEADLRAVIANDPNGSKAQMARRELERRGSARDASLPTPIPVPTKRTAVKAVPMPAGERNEPELAPIPVGDAAYANSVDPKAAQFKRGDKVHNSGGRTGIVLRVDGEEVIVDGGGNTTERWPLRKVFRAADARGARDSPQWNDRPDRQGYYQGVGAVYRTKQGEVDVEYRGMEGSHGRVIVKLDGKKKFDGTPEDAATFLRREYGIRYNRDIARDALTPIPAGAEDLKLEYMDPKDMGHKIGDLVGYECPVYERVVDAKVVSVKPLIDKVMPHTYFQQSKQCPNSNKTFKPTSGHRQVSDTLTPISVDDTKYAEQPKKPMPYVPFGFTKEELHQTLSAKPSAEGFKKQFGKDAVQCEACNRAPAEGYSKQADLNLCKKCAEAGRVQLDHKPRGVVRDALPLDSQVRQAEKALEDAEKDLEAAIKRREPKVVIDDLKEDVKYAQQALAKRKALHRKAFSKDDELKPIPTTRVNPAPAAKTVPVSKAKHVKDTEKPAYQKDKTRHLFNPKPGSSICSWCGEGKAGHGTNIVPAKDDAPENLGIVESYRGHSIYKVKTAGGAERYVAKPAQGVPGLYGSVQELKDDIDRVNKMLHASAKDADLGKDKTGKSINRGDMIEFYRMGGQQHISKVKKLLPSGMLETQDDEGWWVEPSECRVVPPGTKPRNVSPRWKGKDSLESQAAEADRRDAKIIKQEAAGGRLSMEQIAQKHGFPLQMVKDVLTGKAKDRARAADAGASTSTERLQAAQHLEVQGKRRSALDAYTNAAKAARQTGDREVLNAALDGAAECQRWLFATHGSAPSLYTHPQAGRARAYDSAEQALRIAVERTRAGEDVAVVGTRVMPRGKDRVKSV